MIGLADLPLLGGVFLLAGLVKGVTGFGLPTVVLALIALTHGLTEAMVLVLVPAFVTNVWQALGGGQFGPVLRRLWLFLLVAAAGIVAGASLLAGSDPRRMSGTLGLLLAVYAVFGLAAPRLPHPGRHEVWLNPLIGGTTGVLTGLTGSFLMPAVPYLQVIGLPREQFVQALGIAFTMASVTLAAALAGHGLLPPALGLASVAATLPAFAGMLAGAHLRRRLPEILFRRVVLAALGLLGLWLALRALG